MNESLKELAVRYFEGPIATEEECELFGFLAASPENAALMREWEREWKQRHVPSADVLRSLARLNGKIERRENRIRARRRWLRFSAAAAVLILISAFTTRHLIHTEDPVQMFSVQAPQGTNSRISLPDGSQVWLNAGSTLNYRSDFNRSSRDIGLSGEAYFEVARNADLPFRVQARGCTFTVLGTRFNISAYDEDPDVLAALMEGSLQFESSRSTETMVPGDLITYDCRTMEASRRQVDTDQFRSWIDGIIRYDAISLPALLRRLAREYDVNAGGGAVSVKINGKKEILSISIKPEIVDPDDIETLSDVLVAAVNEAIRKVEDVNTQEMQRVTGNVSIPGLF